MKKKDFRCAAPNERRAHHATVLLLWCCCLIWFGLGVCVWVCVSAIESHFNFDVLWQFSLYVSQSGSS